MDEEAFNIEVKRVINLEEKMIALGKTVVVYTKRKLLTLKDDTKEKALIRSVKISNADTIFSRKFIYSTNFCCS